MAHKQLAAALAMILVGVVGIIWLGSGGIGAGDLPAGLARSGYGATGGYGGMMGSGGYGATGGSGGSNRSTVSNAELSALVRSGKGGAEINSKTNSVSYTGSSVTLVALASPHGKPDMTWEIDGLVNPTVMVRQGARVHVVLVNTDGDMLHGFELTSTPPPYPYMAMMGIQNGFFLMPLPPRTAQNLTSARYYTEEAVFTAAPGSYYYLCQVPGHAAAGMFGGLVVA